MEQSFLLPIYTQYLSSSPLVCATHVLLLCLFVGFDGRGSRIAHLSELPLNRGWHNNAIGTVQMPFPEICSIGEQGCAKLKYVLVRSLATPNPIQEKHPS
jgi:hypothetical protein